MRVLIADDHAVVRRGLKQILSEERDISVVGEARNGHEALEMSRRLEWDVAVVDYAMPGRGGVELLKEIKRHHPKRPVLVLSMYPEEWHAVQVLRAGGAGYLSKETATEHPLILSLRPASSDSGDLPKLNIPAPEHKSVRVRLPAKIGEDKTSLVFEIVYEGKGHK